MAGSHKAQGVFVRNKKKVYVVGGLLAAGALTLGACGVSGYGDSSDYPRLNDTQAAEVADAKKDDAEKKEEDQKDVAPPLKDGERAEVELEGTQVANLKPIRAEFLNTFCENVSKLKPAEGAKDKGGLCSEVVIGEIAKNPVKVAFIKPPTELEVGAKAKFNVRVEDVNGPLDLNAFTADASGKAGDTFLEHPGQLQENGTPFAHCHVGVTTLKDGFPSKEGYDAAFSGVQGVKGNLSVNFSGFNAGSYRADVWCSQPGHLILPTSTADKVQAIDSVRFEVK